MRGFELLIHAMDMVIYARVTDCLDYILVSGMIGVIYGYEQ